MGGGPIDPARWYQVVNANSGKCLDVTNFGTANGTPLQQWTCNAPVANNQQWQFRPTSGGQGATADGTDVHLWSYGGGTNQQRQPVALGGGLYRFVARNSGKCLDVRDVSIANGARLQQWTCTGGPAQSFRLAG